MEKEGENDMVAGSLNHLAANQNATGLDIQALNQSPIPKHIIEVETDWSMYQQEAAGIKLPTTDLVENKVPRESNVSVTFTIPTLDRSQDAGKFDQDNTVLAAYIVESVKVTKSEMPENSLDPMTNAGNNIWMEAENELPKTPANVELTEAEKEEILKLRRHFLFKSIIGASIEIFITLNFGLLMRKWDYTRHWFETPDVLYWHFCIAFATVASLLSICPNLIAKSKSVALTVNLITIVFVSLVVTISSTRMDPRTVWYAIGLFLGFTLLGCSLGFIFMYDLTKSRAMITLIVLMSFLGCCVGLSLYYRFDFALGWGLACGMGIDVFILCLAYDMQIMLGGRFLELSTDMYFYAIVTLYWDSMIIFLLTLELGLVIEENLKERKITHYKSHKF